LEETNWECQMKNRPATTRDGRYFNDWGGKKKTREGGKKKFGDRGKSVCIHRNQTRWRWELRGRGTRPDLLEKSGGRTVLEPERKGLGKHAQKPVPLPQGGGISKNSSQKNSKGPKQKQVIPKYWWQHGGGRLKKTEQKNPVSPKTEKTKNEAEIVW